MTLLVLIGVVAAAFFGGWLMERAVNAQRWKRGAPIVYPEWETHGGTTDEQNEARTFTT